MAKVSKKAKRRMTLLITLVIAVVSLVVASVFNDWKQIIYNKKQTKELSSNYQNLLEQEASLEAEVTKFEDPDYIARYAREKYLYSLPGELIIRIPKN